MDSLFPPKTSASNGLAFAEAASLAVFRSNYIKNKRASLPHNTLKESCGILKQKKKQIPFYRELFQILFRFLMNVIKTFVDIFHIFSCCFDVHLVSCSVRMVHSIDSSNSFMFL